MEIIQLSRSLLYQSSSFLQLISSCVAEKYATWGHRVNLTGVTGHTSNLPLIFVFSFLHFIYSIRMTAYLPQIQRLKTVDRYDYFTFLCTT